MKKTALLVLLAALIVSMVALPALANPAQEELKASLATTDRTYEATDSITATLTVTNTASSPVTDVSLLCPVPEGYTLAGGSEGSKELATLDAGASTALAVTFLPRAAGMSSPETGDLGSNGFWMGLVILFAAAFLTLGTLLMKGQRKRYCALLLCLCLAATFPVGAAAATQSKTLEVSTTVTVAGETLTLTAQVTYTPTAGEGDADGDGITDETEVLLGTAPDKADTDADGLRDDLELYKLGTDPLRPDTDSNGVSDGQEDADGDGVANLQELTLGTNPVKADTDSDDIPDGQERTLGTDPTLYDTDGDGVRDGYELTLNTDPLTFEESFHVTQSNESDTLSASVDISLSGEQVSTLKVRPVKSDLFLPETMPGYLGSAYDFSVDGDFTTADIAFSFDSSTLPEGADPAIFYFNQETQQLEELKTTVSGDTATATVEHFSTYILLDRNTYYGSFTWEDTWDSTGTYSTVEVVLVIDDSGSMGIYGDYNDPDYQRLTVAQEMIDRLPEGCKIGVVWFASTSKHLTPELTTDKEAAKALLSRDNFTSRGSYTRMYGAVNHAMELFQSTEPDALKTCIVLTDGRAHDEDLYESTIAAAQEQNVVLYTVGLGDEGMIIGDYLVPLSQQTGGEYYHAQDASQLSTVYEKISQMIDLSVDTDGDTIPDYYEENAVSFSGVDITLDKENADTDGDGVPDNEEVKIELIYSEDGKQVYIKGTLLSAPDLVDTDFDGVTDEADAVPTDGTMTGTLYTSYATSNITTSMDYSWFFGDNTVYNPELSKLSVLLAATIYSGHTMTLTDSAGGSVADAATITGVLGSLGMKNPQTVSLSEMYTDRHLSEVAMGYHNVVVDGELKTVVSVVVRGTNGTTNEWSSNCDIGDLRTDTEDDDWVQLLNHKGFDITATRIRRLVESYIDENSLDRGSMVYWVTGHSRGAAIANIIGANLEREGKTAFTYTFAAPNCTLAEDAGTYRTIFNLINQDDFVPYLPMEYWGYTRYGRSTTTLSIKESYEKVWESLTGIGDYNPDSNGMDDCITKIGYIMTENTDPRVEGYRYTCACHGDGTNDTITITNAGTTEDSREKAIAKIPEIAREYCIITRYQGGWLGGWDFDCCQLPTYLMQILAAFMGGEINAYRFQFELNIATRYEDAKGALVSAALGGIEHPHYCESYYVLADDVAADVFPE